MFKSICLHKCLFTSSGVEILTFCSGITSVNSVNLDNYGTSNSILTTTVVLIHTYKRNLHHK